MTDAVKEWFNKRIEDSDIIATLTANKRNPFSEMEFDELRENFPAISFIELYKNIFTCSEEDYKYRLLNKLDIDIPSGIILTGPDRYLISEMLIKTFTEDKTFGLVSLSCTDILSMKQHQPDSRQLCDEFFESLTEYKTENDSETERYIIQIEDRVQDPYCQMFINQLLNNSEYYSYCDLEDVNDEPIKTVLVLCIVETREDILPSIGSKMNEIRTYFPNKDQRVFFLSTATGLENDSFKAIGNYANIDYIASATEGFSCKTLFDLSRMLKLAIWETNKTIKNDGYVIEKRVIDDIVNLFRTAEEIHGNKWIRPNEYTEPDNNIMSEVLSDIGESLVEAFNNISKSISGIKLSGVTNTRSVTDSLSSANTSMIPEKPKSDAQLDKENSQNILKETGIDIYAALSTNIETLAPLETNARRLTVSKNAENNNPVNNATN